ncbi:MAG: methyltransferase [Pirellulaceae bacterium]
MKKIVKALLDRVVRTKMGYWVLEKTLVRAGQFIEARRQACLGLDDWWYDEFVYAQLPRLFPDLRVQNGPFQGMQYPASESVCSAVFPKLLGSYEREIQPAVEKFCNGHYQTIVDIGCAEGYYAVGMALRNPHANVHAFDIDQRARRLCQAMAALNQVGNRVQVLATCDSIQLRELSKTGRMLVICDCEGFELELFDDETVDAMRGHDLLIELHDGVDPAISGTLSQRYQASHHLQLVSSVDDIRKGQTYDFDQLQDYSLRERIRLLAERRSYVMQWLICFSRVHAGETVPVLQNSGQN